MALSCNGWVGHGQLCVAFNFLYSSDKDTQTKGEISSQDISQLLAMKATSIIAAAKMTIGMECRTFYC